MTPFVQVLGWSLIHALWQGCLLVLLAVAGGAFLQGRARHALNGLVLLLCLVLPAATAWHFHRPEPFGSGRGGMEVQILETLPAARPSAAPSPRSLLVRLEAALQPRLPVLVALWALGAGLMALRLGGGYAVNLRWKRQGIPAPTEWQGVVDALAKRMGIRRPIRLLLARRGDTPMALGLWKLCDDLAAQSLGDPRRLALALNALDDLQPAFPRPFFPALAARGGHLFTRIEKLLSPRPAAGSPWGLLALVLLPCAVLTLRASTPEPPPIGAPVEVVAQLDALAAREGLDPQLLRSMAWVESGFNPAAKSPSGAKGLLQVMPGTARTFGAKDLDDPAQVMAAGAKYLRFLLDRYQGDVPKAVAAYNCGEKALDEGRITEEATRYRALVLDVLAAKAVQLEAPLADGEIQGVLRRSGDRLTVQLRARVRGNLRVDLVPAEKTGDGGIIQIGEMHPDGTQPIRPWTEVRPNIILKNASKAGASLLIRCEDPGIGWRGETRVMLDAPWKTFTFRMEKPQP